MTHSQLVNAILTAHGHRDDCRIWKNHTGLAYTKAGNAVRYGLPGSADILGLHCTGKFIAIECKTGTGRLSEKQQKFKNMVTALNGMYVLARSVQDVDDLLNIPS